MSALCCVFHLLCELTKAGDMKAQSFSGWFLEGWILSEDRDHHLSTFKFNYENYRPLTGGIITFPLMMRTPSNKDSLSCDDVRHKNMLVLLISN